MGPVTAATTAWMDGRGTTRPGLLWNPPGSFEGEVEPRVVHLVRETAWYAIGLLRRDAAGDRARAAAALSAVLDHQYDEPVPAVARHLRAVPRVAGADRRAPSSGSTTTRTGGSSSAPRSAVAITDFDAARRPRVPSARGHRPRDRLASHRTAYRPPTPTSPCCGPGSRRGAASADDGLRGGRRRRLPAARLLHRVRLAHLLRHRPARARACGSAPTHRDALQRGGRELEAALWADVARWWHAGLGNLCGPYSRAYGMDLGSYVSGLSLALWCAGLPAPLPPLDADLVPHGHDLCMAPFLEHVGVRVPPRPRRRVRALPGPARGRTR